MGSQVKTVGTCSADDDGTLLCMCDQKNPCENREEGALCSCSENPDEPDDLLGVCIAGASDDGSLSCECSECDFYRIAQGICSDSSSLVSLALPRGKTDWDLRTCSKLALDSDDCQWDQPISYEPPYVPSPFDSGSCQCTKKDSVCAPLDCSKTNFQAW